MRLEFEGDRAGRFSINVESYLDKFTDRAEQVSAPHQKLETGYESFEKVTEELKGSEGRIEMEDRSVLPRVEEENKIGDLGEFLEENSKGLETEFAATAYSEDENLVYGSIVCHIKEDHEKTPIIPLIPIFTDVLRPLQFEFRKTGPDHYRVKSQYLSPTEIMLENIAED